MFVRIFQIDMELDAQRVKFSHLEMLQAMNTGVDPGIYREVFSGAVDCADLEEVYEMFNLDHPAGFKGHSLSVSDIVQTEDGFFYDNGDEYKKIDFDASQVAQPEPEPGEPDPSPQMGM